MSRKRVKKSECPNCSFKLSEIYNYCPGCGQENHTHKVPAAHFIMETFEVIFHFDKKLLVTIRDLFIPGKITLNYNQNKRARYVPPVRFYVFISFIFFLLLSFSLSKIKEGDTKGLEIDVNQVDTSEFSADTTGGFLLEQIKASPHPNNLIDKYLFLRYKDLNWFNKKMYRSLVKYTTGHYGSREFLHSFYKSISYSMFFLMPIFALYLLLVYRRMGLFYSEHLIFSIHFHSLSFILLSLWSILNMLHIHIGILILSIILLYLLLIMRKVYIQSWLKTIGKFIIVGLLYAISIITVIFFGLVISTLIQ